MFYIYFLIVFLGQPPLSWCEFLLVETTSSVNFSLLPALLYILHLRRYRTLRDSCRPDFFSSVIPVTLWFRAGTTYCFLGLTIFWEYCTWSLLQWGPLWPKFCAIKALVGPIAFLYLPEAIPRVQGAAPSWIAFLISGVHFSAQCISPSVFTSSVLNSLKSSSSVVETPIPFFFYCIVGKCVYYSRGNLRYLYVFPLIGAVSLLSFPVSPLLVSLRYCDSYCFPRSYCDPCYFMLPSHNPHVRR